MNKLSVVALLLVVGCETSPKPNASVADGHAHQALWFPDGGLFPDGSTGFTPLTDFVDGGTYKGFPGLLYPDANFPPPAHRLEALSRALQMGPVDTDGGASDAGRFVLISIGMSCVTQEWCIENAATDGGIPAPCDDWTFTGQALLDPAVDQSKLVIINGAMATKSADSWDEYADFDYNRVRFRRLAPLGLTEKQVLAAWVKLVHTQPSVALPDLNADAYLLKARLGNVVRTLKLRYPNLKLIYFSSRSYGGWSEIDLNPEPYAYENGFAVKWLIEAQIRQMQDGGVDSLAGDLDYTTVAPWIGWGPYLWADGLIPRSDGLTWPRTDFEDDGIHPSESGEQKVGSRLLHFFKNNPSTRCWFLTSATCP